MRKYIYHFVLIALLLTSCTPMENPVVKFYGVSLNNEILAIGYGDSYQLIASVLPGRSSDKVTFEWTSNNAAVAEVDDNGLVTAQNHGEAIITVTASFEGTSFSSTCAVTVVPVDVYIPDDNFRNYCLENFDTNGDGVLSSTETVSVYDLRVSNTGIISLEGIQYFKSLNLIHCGSNQLEFLDVSQNTNLKDLTCSGNQLIALDVSQNALLTRLDCSYNQLIDLDVSQNSLLGRLICTYNQLTTLDVSQNSHLLELECR
ncbi:MAG: Ig-like domain-containing protein, partial [Paludibacter sp.]|nr:Ig-like domain-containing protein [Paludibacter sp.]